ncbi:MULTISPECIES: RHS repeat-associated core domain-containing protein, partial [unclassified Pseudomonas]|uniref:RHS repeat-associated core domain-containing protein n=1 Tax=unclassified Pseudomonas TaxID=196821 RepID=UPI0035C14D61
QSTLISYLTESSHNTLLHGRVNVQQLILRDPTDPSRDKSASSTFFYSRVQDDAGQPLLQTRETFKGHDLAERVVTRASSILSGQLLRDQDPNLVEVHYRYDALQRLLSETVAPGTAFESTRRYAYTLGRETSETVTNVNGVTTRTWFDGYNRPLWQERETLDEKTGQRAWHKVEATRYDDVGRVAEQTTYDYLDEQTLSLTTTFGYDGWGERTTALQPDGVVVCHQRSPFGEEGYIVENWQERADEPRPRQRRQFTRSEFNRFDKPLRDERLASDGQLVGSTAYAYDGYGRSIRLVQQLRDPLGLHNAPIEQITRFAYDAWGRMVSTQRPDGTTLVRRFASHSSNELTTELELVPEGSQTGSLICKRGFDGLERLTSLTVGNRTETYRYQGQRVLVHERDKASGRTLSYAYIPELTSEPETITVKGALAADGQATFAYARHDASITSTQNGTGKRDYAYTDQGYLARESWTGVQPGQDFAIDHLASLQGRPMERNSSDGLITAHTYDSEGRLHTTTQGALSARFSYDADGRLWQTVTQDSASQRQATCTVEYDSLGRETARTTELDNGSSSGTQLTWRDDDLLHSRRTLRDGQVHLLETFSYDALNRLTRADYEADDPQSLPRNRAGRGITSQVLRFDELDNLTRCQTRFGDGTVDDARFSYGAASKADVHDQFQLREATHTLQPDYPATQAFSYDADGNQLNDEWGRQLHYDVMGRLEQVVGQQGGEPLVRYRYDGHDHLTGVHWQGQSHEQLRRYEGYRLSAVRQGDQLTQLLHGSDQPLGQQRHGQASDALLLLTDSAGSVTDEYGPEGVQQAHYSLYGERGDDDALRSLLGFNGEVREQQLDWYLLGRGYRAYNPGLMRFHSPDSLPPEVTGINPYLYALGNPVNWRDPTGHRASPTPSRDPKPPYIDPVEEPKQLSGFMTFLPFIIGTVGMILGGVVAFLAPPILAVGVGVLAAAAGAGVVAAVAPAIEDPSTRFIVEQLGWGLIGFGTSAALGGMYARFQGKVPWTQSPRTFAKAATTATATATTATQTSPELSRRFSNQGLVPGRFKPRAAAPAAPDADVPAAPPPPPPSPVATPPSPVATTATPGSAIQPSQGQQMGAGVSLSQLQNVRLQRINMRDRAPIAGTSSAGAQLFGSQQGTPTGEVRQLVLQ